MSAKYIFLTYGSKRIKGVQTKAISISKYLPQKEVLIINHGDASWLKQNDLNVLEYDFNTWSYPTKKDPVYSILKNAKVIIFCDFPTNMLFQSIIFWFTYKNLKKPIAICDNIYNSHQFENKIYTIYYQLSDALLLSGVSFFEKYLNNFPKSYLIPPFFDIKSDKEKENVKNRKNETKKILYIAYNEKVYQVSKKIINSLKREKVDHYIIVPPNPQNIEELKKEKSVSISDKILTKKEILDAMIEADIIICKFGYQQLIESLSLGKPTITVGDSGLKKDWLDKEIEQTFFYFEEYGVDIENLIKKLLNDKIYYKELQKGIKKIHNGEYNGAEKAANIIKKLNYTHKEKLSKNVLLAFNTKENINKIREVMQKELFVYPIIISNRFAERDFGYPKEINPLEENLNEITFAGVNEFIDPSFSLIFNFSNIAYQGLSSIFPYLDEIMESTKKILKESEKIYIIGPEAKTFFSKIIKEAKKEEKTIYG